jgi:hypothetical protein
MPCQVIQAPGSGSDIVARDSRLVKGGFLIQTEEYAHVRETC